MGEEPKYKRAYFHIASDRKTIDTYANDTLRILLCESTAKCRNKRQCIENPGSKTKKIDQTIDATGDAE